MKLSSLIYFRGPWWTLPPPFKTTKPPPFPCHPRKSPPKLSPKWTLLPPPFKKGKKKRKKITHHHPKKQLLEKIYLIKIIEKIKLNPPCLSLKKRPILPFPCHAMNKNPLQPHTQNQHLWGGKKLNTQPSPSPLPFSHSTSPISSNFKILKTYTETHNFIH